ncbi:MAG: GerMN domain-containing protein [Actinomycetota bacterium]|nr:GerMN domain-containing protein [Actinomycetota bacterium]
MRTIRIRTRHYPAVVALIGLLFVGACASPPERDDGTALEPGGSAGGTEAPATPAPTPADPSDPANEPTGESRFVVWFHESDKLSVMHRTEDETPAIARAAMESLLGGPNGPEGETGVETQIPDGTELLGLTIEGGIAEVDLSGRFESGGGSLSMFMRLGQVVCTLDQFDTVDKAILKIDGERVETFSGEGIDVSDPMKCGDFEDQLPAIVVLEPAPGDHVDDPVKVSGNANVFEATVSARLVDADGRVLDKTFATATCGTGCRGEFSLELSRKGAAVEHAIVEVWWDSPEDGSRQEVIRIPVNF